MTGQVGVEGRAGPSAPEERPYDVFVSFAEADRVWVHGYLITALERSGVSWCTTDTFGLGTPFIEAAVRGVQSAHRVLLVVSGGYEADRLGRFVALLGQHYGVEEGEWPVIVLVRGRVEQLPLNLRALPQIPVTTQREQTEAMQRLAAELQRPPPAPSTRPPCPYPGILPFEPSQQAVFFGREHEIDMAV